MIKKRRVDYNKKEYNNPFFRKKKKLSFSFKKVSSKNKILGILVGIVIIFIIFYMFFSKNFLVRDIEINGLIRVTNTEVEAIVNKTLNQKRFFLLSMRNIFLLKSDLIIGDIKSELFFEKLEIKKKFPDTIIIDIQEKSQSIIWCENEKYYHADIDGYLIDEINPLDLKDNKLPIVENKSNFLIDTNKISIDDINDTFKYIIKLNEDFSRTNSLIKVEKEKKLEVEKFILNDESESVYLKLLEGPSLYFNLNESQEKQLNKLLVIINEKLKNDFINKEYIDLRYGERVYYR